LYLSWNAGDQLGRVSLNAINTCDGSGATGLGLFLSAAMFNHSCTPNCQAWWRGSKVTLAISSYPTTGLSQYLLPFTNSEFETADFPRLVVPALA